MREEINKTFLAQHWVHSHEEDTEDEAVYRPATFSFPLSRGRSAFSLEPDGILVKTGIGPTDRREESRGTWKLEAGNKLAFYMGPGTEPDKVYTIVSLVGDKLVLKKSQG